MANFGSLPIGEIFDYGGNLFRKRSTRTAVIVKSRTYNPDNLRWAIHDDHSGVWGYFNARQNVNQEQHWWRTMQGAAAITRYWDNVSQEEGWA